MGNIFLFPLRLLVFLVRLPIALLDVLVFFLYAVVLYVVAIPAFLLNALYQLVIFPIRLFGGQSGQTDFRARWFFYEPLVMFLKKEADIASWVLASWDTFQSRKQREQTEQRRKDHYQTYFERKEPVLISQTKSARREPILPRYDDELTEELADIPVFGEELRWPCKKDSPFGYVPLICPHCEKEAENQGKGYPVQNKGAAIFQFIIDPGDQYTGGEECGIFHCSHCGRRSYMVEVLADKGIFNYKTNLWEFAPDLKASPVAEIQAGPANTNEIFAVVPERSPDKA